MRVDWLKGTTKKSPEKKKEDIVFGLKPVEDGIKIEDFPLIETKNQTTESARKQGVWLSDKHFQRATGIDLRAVKESRTDLEKKMEGLSTEVEELSGRLGISTTQEEPEKRVDWTKGAVDQKNPYDDIKVDLLPNDSGFKIYGEGIPEQIVYRNDFNEEQESAFQRMKDIKLLESKMSELEDLYNSYQGVVELASIQTGLATIPGVGAVDVLGRALGVQLGAAKAIKAENEYLNQQIAAQNKVLEEIKIAQEGGDFEKARKLVNILPTLSDDLDVLKSSITITEKQLAAAPNKKQIIAASVELALMAVGRYKPHLPGAASFHKVTAAQMRQFAPIKQATNLFKIKNAADAMYQVERYGRIAAKSGVKMALWHGTQMAKISDSSTQDIIDAAEKGFKRGVIIAPAFTFVGDLIGFGLEKATPHIKKLIAEMEKTFRKMAKGERPKGKLSGFDIAMEGIETKPTFKQKVGEAGVKTIDFFERIPQRFVDEKYPFKKVEDFIYETKGEALSENEKLYRDARMLDYWSGGKSGGKVLGLSEKLSQYSPETQTNAKAYLNLLDKIDRAELGLEVAGSRELGELREALGNFAVEMGREEMGRLAEIRKFVKGFHVDQLQGLVDAGLKSSEEIQKIMLAHPNYIPHDVVLDQIEKSFIQIGAKTLDVPEKVLHKAFGSARKIEDPFQAIVSQTYYLDKLAEKNTLINNLYQASIKYGESDNILGDIKKIKGLKEYTNAINRGDGVISFFLNGKETNISVPKNLAIAIKGLEVPVTPDWWKAMTSLQRLLKAGATEYNAAFIVNNKFRDTDTASALTGSLIEDTAKRYGFDLANAKDFTADEINKIYAKGGWGYSIFNEGELAAKKILRKAGMSKDFNFIESINPYKAIGIMNEFVEQSTRKATLLEALAAGLNEKDALWVSLNATIDFGRMGSWMRIPNQLIPFLNANLQGLLAIPKAYLSSPERFTEAIMTTSVLPSFLLHQHNRRYESYKYISQALKDHNWIIMTGEVPAINPHTNEPILVPQFITIKRGEPQSMVAGPIMWWLEKEDGIDDRKVTEMLADTVGAIGPTDFGLFSRENFFRHAISSIGPYGSIPAGSVGNIDPFFGTKIIPESRTGLHKEMQYTERTPQILKDIPKEFYRGGIAERFNISPGMLDYYISAFGGAAKDTLRALDLVYNVMRDGKIGGLNVTETPFETLTEIPVIDSFLRQRMAGSTEAERKMIQDIRRDVLTDNAVLNEEADDIVKNLREKNNKYEVDSYLSSIDEILTPKLKSKIIERSEPTGSVNGLSASESVEVRARVILVNLEKMKSKGASSKEIKEYLLKLAEAKVLTKSVREEIAKIQQLL